jgi:3D (Asp-Asp-Asp) domain-containing protein
MRIRTKLAFACGSFIAFYVLAITENARADDSNQTKINYSSIATNILASGNIQTLSCNAKENVDQFAISENAINNVKKTEAEIIINEEEKKVRNRNFPTGKFQVNASAYTASTDECGKNDGVTASGVRVRENETIACPMNFPFGTKINIDGYGIYVCQDRGGAIEGNKIDIYMKTKTQAFAFGRRELMAEIINE